MPNIGIVLAGGMSKGAYEIGCLKAISEYFSQEDIRYISASSIGVLNAYAYSCDRLDELIEEWKSININNSGKFFPSYSGNPDIIQKICNFVKEGDLSNFRCKMYGTVWNYTQKQLEYVSFHKLSTSGLKDYLCASIALPVFNKGVRINNCTMFDGAFIDNIPVYPLLKKNIDYIFCIYFDQKNYIFENDAFDSKIIKLYQFPEKRKFENLTFDPNKINDMVEYGYKYTKKVIKEIFDPSAEDLIYKRIKDRETRNSLERSPRFTGDVLLTNINKMTSRYSKRQIL